MFRYLFFILIVTPGLALGFNNEFSFLPIGNVKKFIVTDYNFGLQEQNVSPTITGHSALVTNEEHAITLALSDLTVSDPDNAYPLGFTMTASAGTNYSVDGLTIIPFANFNGTLTVPVTVNDGTSSSAPFNVQIQVNPVNDPPTINGQAALNTNEEQSIELGLSHLSVTDPDNTYPDGFTLSISTGDNFTAAGTTITPAVDFNGLLNVPVTVFDGGLSSNIFNLQIQVNAVNDPPTITSQIPLQINEEGAIVLALSHLNVTDPDHTYPNGFTLAVSTGDNYQVSGNTITAISNFSGVLFVPVTVSDGAAVSNTFNVEITVVPQNDPPVITGQTPLPLTTNEEQPIAIELSNLLVSDIDNAYPNGFTLNVIGGSNYVVQGSSVVPVANFSGTLSVPVTVNDGISASTPFNVAIQVIAVNDAPLITGQQVVQVNEDNPFTIQLSHLQVADRDNTYPTGFTLVALVGNNYSLSGTTITPVGNFTGVLSVPVTVNDGINNSQQFIFQIQVLPVNDSPVIISQTALQTNEDLPITLQLSNLTVSDPDNTYPNEFTLAITQGTNFTVSGNIITPSPNFTGSLTVPVTVNDGVNTSSPFNVQITVVPVNDPPIITGQFPLNVYKNHSLKIELSHLKATDTESTYPQNFTLRVLAGSNYTVLNNTITPTADFLGRLDVNVVINDGSANSNTYPLQVNVIRPPNVVPVITGQIKLVTHENQPLTLQLSHLLVTDPDNVFPGDFQLDISKDSKQYTVNGNIITPIKDFSGVLNVKVTVSDKESTSNPYTLIIEVIPVTDVPLITSQAFLNINEDDSLVIKFSHLLVLDPDNTYPNGFTLKVSPGTNYSLDGLKIKPLSNYNGYLSVPVTVNDGVNTSTPYNLSILVNPVNDAPVVSSPKPEPLIYTSGKESLKIFENLAITDVDDDSLTLAEISFDPQYYEASNDSLIFQSLPSIRAVLDYNAGILILLGKASIHDYKSIINNIQFAYSGTASSANKIVQVMASDGKLNSQTFEQKITIGGENILLDIPSGFTPNGDGVNDTWSIKSIQGNDGFAQALVRIYSKRGGLVFEATGLDQEWEGKLNGALLPADTYFYTIDLQGFYAKKRYQGVIVILR